MGTGDFSDEEYGGGGGGGAGIGGAAFNNAGSIEFTASTITRNTAGGGQGGTNLASPPEGFPLRVADDGMGVSGGLFVRDGSVEFANTIVAKN